VSSNRSLNCSLSRGSRPRIVHRSTVDSRVSCASCSSFDISFTDGLLMPIPRAGGRPFYSAHKPKKSNRFAFAYFSIPAVRKARWHLWADSSRYLCLHEDDFFAEASWRLNGSNLPKNSVSCPITPAGSVVVRQSPVWGRARADRRLKFTLQIRPDQPQAAPDRSSKMAAPGRRPTKTQSWGSEDSGRAIKRDEETYPPSRLRLEGHHSRPLASPA
jgi:hypothetical protein